MSYTNLLYHIVFATKGRAPLMEHHKRVTLEDELKALLGANRIDFDEKSLWLK
jgi:REP element-mobilizing transposase RayT